MRTAHEAQPVRLGLRSPHAHQLRRHRRHLGLAWLNIQAPEYRGFSVISFEALLLHNTTLLKAYIMATSTKSRARTTPVADAIPKYEETVHAAHISDDGVDIEFENLKRETIASWIGLIATGTVGYWGTVLVQYASLGVLVMTGSAFLSFMVYFLGIVAAIAVAIMAGNAVQRAITEGAIGKSVDSIVLGTTHAYYSARQSVASMFNRKGATT